MLYLLYSHYEYNPGQIVYYCYINIHNYLNTALKSDPKVWHEKSLIVNLEQLADFVASTS